MIAKYLCKRYIKGIIENDEPKPEKKITETTTS
jgi:hypothetical protein